jgi:glycolate oxidase FAD binding subunit
LPADALRSFTEAIRAAATGGTRLRIRGGGTKDFYGQALEGEILGTHAYAGVVAYDPTELVITVRGGTPLAEVERVLAEKRQMLAFEPPHFGPGATIGGAVAAGLSGPRRATAGAVRDFVLGVRIVDGRGDDLRFGGQVMKNVAGFDVSRLVAGSLGTLGLLTEVSLKVLPVPVADETIRLEMPQDKAIETLNKWGGKPLPIVASCHENDALTVRLAGAAAAVASARAKLGGEPVPGADIFWITLREHVHMFFADGMPLWRLSVPSVTPPLALPGEQLVEWGGALRWLRSNADARTIRDAVAKAGGHATLFRGGDKSVGVFHALTPAIAKLTRNVKAAMDPEGVLNRGRMYPGL